jgi:hypothetical protein
MEYVGDKGLISYFKRQNTRSTTIFKKLPNGIRQNGNTINLDAHDDDEIMYQYLPSVFNL